MPVALSHLRPGAFVSGQGGAVGARGGRARRGGRGGGGRGVPVVLPSFSARGATVGASVAPPPGEAVRLRLRRVHTAIRHKVIQFGFLVTVLP